MFSAGGRVDKGNFTPHPSPLTLYLSQYCTGTRSSEPLNSHGPCCTVMVTLLQIRNPAANEKRILICNRFSYWIDSLSPVHLP